MVEAGFLQSNEELHKHEVELVTHCIDLMLEVASQKCSKAGKRSCLVKKVKLPCLRCKARMLMNWGIHTGALRVNDKENQPGASGQAGSRASETDGFAQTEPGSP